MEIRRRPGIIASVVAGVLLVTTGCNAPDEGGEDGAIQIGLLANLTGEAATSFGEPFERGFELAFDDAAGSLDEAGLSVEVVAEDTQSAVPPAVTGYNRLRQAGVPIVVNDSQSPQGQAVAPLANDDEIAFLSGGGSEVENPDGYAFRLTDLVTPTTGMGEYIIDQGATRVGVVVAGDNPSFSTLADVTEEGLPDGYASRQEVSSADSDFSAVLANLRQDDVDAVVVSVLPAQAGNLLLQMRQSGGFEDVLLAGTLATSSETYTVAEDAAAGLIFPQVWAPGDSGGAEFETAYEEEYGEPPTAYGALGYQTGWIVAAALVAAEEGGEIDGTTLRDALPEASNSDLVSENGILSLELTEDGTAVSEGVLATFADDGTIQAADR